MKQKNNMQHRCSRARHVLANSLCLTLLYAVVFSYVCCASVAVAKEVHCAFIADIPPYFIQEENAGIEYEIIEEALAQKGHLLIPHFLPPKRVPYALTTHKVQAASPLPASLPIKNVFFSSTHITYRNVVVIPKKWATRIQSLEQLSDIPVLAFQHARRYLPKSFQKMAATNKNYYETADQRAQVHSFHSKKNRAIVLDERIFRHYTHALLPKDRIAYQVLRFFPPTQYSVGFLSEQLRDDFNEGLRLLRTTGTYARLMSKYLVIYE